MRRIRLTERRALLRKGHTVAKESIVKKIVPVFKKQFKKLEKFLRRANLRKRLDKITIPSPLLPIPPQPLVFPRVFGTLVKVEVDDMDNIDALYKVDQLLKQEDSPTSDSEEWEEWKKTLMLALLLGLFAAVDEIAGIENRIWESRGRDRLTYDAESIILAYQLRTGNQLDSIALVTMAAVERIIADWYVTEKPFTDLISKLKTYFNDSRINMIADTEAGNILSQIVLQAMDSYGITEWYWDHIGEDVPCSKPIPMLGVSYKGCRELNGKKFPLGAPMPPHAAHPFCHCLPTPVGI